MKIVSFIDKHLEEVLCAVLLAVMTIVIFLQIVLRLLGLPLSWTEEIGRYMFIWLIYIGCASAIRKRKHISVELLDLFLKERGVSGDPDAHVYSVQFRSGGRRTHGGSPDPGHHCPLQRTENGD